MNETKKKYTINCLLTYIGCHNVRLGAGLVYNETRGYSGFCFCIFNYKIENYAVDLNIGWWGQISGRWLRKCEAQERREEKQQQIKDFFKLINLNILWMKLYTVGFLGLEGKIFILMSLKELQLGLL